jgi:hypothetical protein
MKLGLGGIGQTTQADKQPLLISKGVIAGIVNISGKYNGETAQWREMEGWIKTPLNGRRDKSSGLSARR